MKNCRTLNLIIAFFCSLLFLTGLAPLANASLCREVFAQPKSRVQLNYEPTTLKKGQIIYDAQLAVVPMGQILRQSKTVTTDSAFRSLKGYQDFLHMRDPSVARKKYKDGQMSFTDYVMLLIYHTEFYSEVGHYVADIQYRAGQYWYFAKAELVAESPFGLSRGAVFTNKIVEEVINRGFDYDRQSMVHDGSPSALARFVQKTSFPSVQLPVLSTTATKDSPVKVDITNQLISADVGGAKGHADRDIVADTFLAKTEPGVIPTLATSDKTMTRGLLRLKLGRELADNFMNNLRNNARPDKVTQLHPDVQVVMAKGYGHAWGGEMLRGQRARVIRPNGKRDYSEEILSNRPGDYGPEGQIAYRMEISDISITDINGQKRTINVIFYFTDTKASWIYSQNYPVW